MPKPLPNEIVTICVEREINVYVYDGKHEGSRLIAQASGIDIYLYSRDNTRHPDCINNMMQNICLERHIPLLSLHMVKTVIIRSNRLKTETKEMF